MGTIQIATRIDEEQSRRFRDTTKKLGTTPADALRIFISAFNENKGFPFEVRIKGPQAVEPFETEGEATEFATRLSRA